MSIGAGNACGMEVIMGYGYGYGYGYYNDPFYILIIISVIIAMVAQFKVKSTFSKYSGHGARSGITGAEAARKILEMNGIYNVRIEHVSGSLTDHFDPRSNVLRLSDSVYGSNSIAAIGVAAHECGHAIQHDRGYAPIRIRNAIVPVVNVSSYASWFFILAGLFLGSSTFLIDLGIILFSFSVLFQLVTLPVEFDASGRALRILDESGMLDAQEVSGARKVLSAAAMTYVASALTAVLQLLRLISLFGGRRRD